MAERYEPSSDFLKAVIAEKIPFEDDASGAANLRTLIAMIGDEDRTNRDWAAFLLSQTGLDTPEIRATLLRAADDQDEFVRAEAIEGLAQRDPALALPFLQKILSGGSASAAIFEAAILVADPSLIDDLRDFAVPSGNDLVDDLAREALAACEKAAGTA